MALAPLLLLLTAANDPLRIVATDFRFDPNEIRLPAELGMRGVITIAGK